MVQHKQYKDGHDVPWTIILTILLLSSISFIIYIGISGAFTPSNIEPAQTYGNYANITYGNFELKETFTIPKYRAKSLCKVIDSDLNIVCYINAVGGCIQCFKLDDVSTQRLESVEPIPYVENNTNLDISND